MSDHIRKKLKQSTLNFGEKSAANNESSQSSGIEFVCQMFLFERH